MAGWAHRTARAQDTTMLNRAGVGLAMLIATMEPAMPTQPGELDLVKYAITQGGLLAVVLILLWSRWRDDQRITAAKDNQIQELTNMATVSATALARSAESVDRMARAIEQLSLSGRRRMAP